MKRLIALTLIVVLALTVLAGCASKPADNTAPANNKTVNTSNPATADNTVTEKRKLTEDEAIEIALEHAGFAKSDVSKLHAEYDYDDGVYKYEIDFRQGMYEYEYEIDALDGKIISYDKDYDD